MATHRTGKDAVITLNIAAGGAVAVASLRKWEGDYSIDEVDSTVCGDTVRAREGTFKVWEANFEAVLEAVTTYVLPVTLVGASVAVAMKVLSGDANGLLSGTGFGKNLHFSAPHDNLITITGKVVCNGTDLAFDLTPAS